MSKKQELTVREIGRLGGKACYEANGPAHMSDIGRLGAQAQRAKLGEDGMREIARKGGQTTVSRHGTELYRELGKRGGAEAKRLIERGKALEAEAGDGRG